MMKKKKKVLLKLHYSKTSLDNQYSYTTEHSSDYDEFEL